MNWIKCSRKLPPFGEWVLLASKFAVFEGRRMRNRNHKLGAYVASCIPDERVSDNVTHWMPLPEPPHV